MQRKCHQNILCVFIRTIIKVYQTFHHSSMRVSVLFFLSFFSFLFLIYLFFYIFFFNVAVYGTTGKGF